MKRPWQEFLRLEQALARQREAVRADIQRRMKARGWSIARLAEEARCNTGGLRQLLNGVRWNAVIAQKCMRAFGLDGGPPRERKRAYAPPELLAARNRAIRARLRAGETPTALAEVYGISRQRIARIGAR